jgi:CelD/BcsL family acetyltransferase involved in cellulose biosynthesis
MSTAPLRARPSPEVTAVNAVTGIDTFAAMEADWNSLVTAHNNIFFMRHEFLRAWMESFAPQEGIEILTGRSDDGRLVAALPLQRKTGSLHGVPVREIVALANTHSCRFDMVAEDPDSAGKAFFQHLARRDDWDVLRILDVPETGQTWNLYNAAMAAGYPVGIWESQRSPYLTLPAIKEELQGRVSTQQRANARRRMRQMEAKGAVQFELLRATDSARIPAVLEDFFEVEKSGWKGAGGTAVDQDGSTRTFYTRLAEVCAKNDWLSLYKLTLNGQSVAFQYGITYNGSYMLPKLTFREEFSELSPGLVLMHEILLDSISRGLQCIDMLGSDDEWKLRWSRTVLPHYWLYIFRDNFKGRTLQKMKFSWGPKLKDIMNRASTRGREQ